MPDNLRFCCVSGDRGPKVNSDNPDKKEVFLQLMNIRDKALEGMKNHILPKECEGCACYREYDLDSPDTPKEITEKLNEKPLISYIIVNFGQFEFVHFSGFVIWYLSCFDPSPDGVLADA